MGESEMVAAFKDIWDSLPKETFITPEQFSRLDGQCAALMPEMVIPAVNCFEDGWL